MTLKKITVAMTERMLKDLEKEMNERGLTSVAQAARIIIGEYFSEYA